MEGIFEELDVLRDLEEDGLSGNHLAHPRPGGLIPWSESGGALAFLVGLIDGSIERRGLPHDVPGPDPVVRVYPG